MNSPDRRHFRRARLRLRIGRVEGLKTVASDDELWTADVSPGGMFFRAALLQPPSAGQAVSFELEVPPGAGYWASDGRVRGSGRIVRAKPIGEDYVGVALEFTCPLTLDF